ncbi:AAA family ATPase [Halorubrum coriense]|nr:AAA family ATPase [Halorubrum coriense]
MAIFFTRGRKAPYQQHVGFSLSNYLSAPARAELQARIEDYRNQDFATSTADNLCELLNSNTVTVWGAKEKHKDHFEQMAPGDLAVFIDTSNGELDHCMQVDLTLGSEVPRQLRKDLSQHIWRDDSFEYIWLSKTPIERLGYPTTEFESFIQEADENFAFPTSWFSMGDDFEQLSVETMAELGGQAAVHEEISKNGVRTLSPDPGSGLLLDSDHILDQGHWAIAAKYTDVTGITADTASFERYKEGQDPRIGYFRLARGSEYSDLLKNAENDARVLIHDNGTVVKQGRLANIEGKVIEGTTYDLATIFDIRETPKVDIAAFTNSSNLSDFLEEPFDKRDAPISNLPTDQYEQYQAAAYGRDTATRVDGVASDEHLQKRVYREATAHLVAGRNVVFYGPPGTGKTRAASKLTDALDIGQDTATANAEWSNYDVVGGYEPAGPDTPEQEWTAKAGVLSSAAQQCVEGLTLSGDPHWLLVDELNRANLDQAFGDVFTLLDLDYRTSQRLKFGTDEVTLPLSFRLLATMNTSDRAKLFSLGYAFRRRFAFVQVPPLYTSGGDPDQSDPTTSPRKIPNHDEIHEIVTGAVVDDLTRQRLLVDTWDSHRMPTRDAATIDPAFAMESVVSNALDNVLAIDYGWDDADPLDVVLAITYQLSGAEYDIVDIGQALAIDIIRYLTAAQLLSDGDITRQTVDRALIAYLLPQIDVFMSELRKAETLSTTADGESTPAGRYSDFTTWIGSLGLPEFHAELEEAADSYSVL